MSFGFKNIGHFFATVAGDIVKGARAVTIVMLKAQKAEPEIEALSALIVPQAVELERGAFALLGLAAHAVSEAGDAAAANGINIALDQQLIADIKQLIVAIEAYAKSAGLQKPVAGSRGSCAQKEGGGSTRAHRPFFKIPARESTRDVS